MTRLRADRFTVTSSKVRLTGASSNDHCAAVGKMGRVLQSPAAMVSSQFRKAFSPCSSHSRSDHALWAAPSSMARYNCLC